jgi:hypothetical protein
VKAKIFMRHFTFILLGATLMCGCQGMRSPVEPQTYEPKIGENTTPLLIDQAMQSRDWNRSVALYSSGNTIAGPTGFLYQLNWNNPGWSYAVLETPLFIGQALALPVTLAIAPPWNKVRYTGDWIGPTYTAMPPLPDASAKPSHY